MLSRVLTEAVAEAQPVTWRRSAPIPAKAIHGGRPLDEATQLRAHIAELSAGVEKQGRQAYEQGMRAGEAAARKALEGEVRAVIEKLTAGIAEIASTRADTLRRAEADTVRLAVEVARRVLHRELSVDPNALQALTRAALDKLQSQEIFRVRLHPAQEALVRACLQQAGRGIEVIPDPSQPLGGIIFEIARGSLDASAFTQLDEIERGLTDQLDTRP